MSCRLVNPEGMEHRKIPFSFLNAGPYKPPLIIAGGKIRRENPSSTSDSILASFGSLFLSLSLRRLDLTF